MNNQAARRKVRKRKSPVQNSRMKLSGFLGIMLLAVFLGYLTARFVVGPIIGYDASESPARIAEEDQEKDKDKEQDAESADKDDDEKEDAAAETGEDSSDSESSSVSAAPTEGYALQFGVFSNREGAEKLSESLKTQGIDTEIVEIDDIYKVISPVVDTKEKALDQLTALSDKEVDDVFVTSFQ